MPLESLDHYTIKTTDIEGTARFYEEVLGMARGPMPETDGGVFDHIAFRATGYAEIKERLAAHGAGIMEQHLPQIGLHQIFARCDDGTWVELIFDPTELEDAA